MAPSRIFWSLETSFGAVDNGLYGSKEGSQSWLTSIVRAMSRSVRVPDEAARVREVPRDHTNRAGIPKVPLVVSIVRVETARVLHVESIVRVVMVRVRRVVSSVRVVMVRVRRVESTVRVVMVRVRRVIVA